MRHALLVPLLLALVSPTACNNERPVECLKLRQCCALAASTGRDVEELRVPCTRADDSDAVLCQRRLDQVRAAIPAIADDAQCR